MPAYEDTVKSTLWISNGQTHGPALCAALTATHGKTLSSDW